MGQPSFHAREATAEFAAIAGAGSREEKRGRGDADRFLDGESEPKNGPRLRVPFFSLFLPFSNFKSGNTPLSVGFSPDGKLLVCCCGNDVFYMQGLSSLIVLELSSDTRRTIQCDSDWHCFAFSPDGRKLMAAGKKGLVSVLMIR
jgi:hypothetical protein